MTAIAARGLVRPSQHVGNRVSLCIFIAVAAVMRAQWIGDPLPHLDEQFYLLVADRMWRGDLPFVDIWDRKPIGLFLLYAALRIFSPNGIVAYQIGAAGFAVATAFTIMRIGLRLGDRSAATFAGVIYLLSLGLLGGNSGQTPVFYNLFTALAVLLLVRSTEGEAKTVLNRQTVCAMLLLGLAIQIKYTATVSAVAFGLYLSWQQMKLKALLRRSVAVIVILASATLLPTIAAASFYTAIGHASDFVQSNFVSIFLTRKPPDLSYVIAFFWLLLRLTPMLAIAGWSVVRSSVFFRSDETARICLLWAAATLIETFVLGRFYGHYALPALAALATVSAPLLCWRPAAIVATSFLFSCVYLPHVVYAGATTRANRKYVASIVTAMQPYAASGCLYLRDGPSTVYLLTGSCLPTPYVFPHHLTQFLEARATDAEHSMRRLLASRPSAIAISDRRPEGPPEPATAVLLARVIAEDYHLNTKIAEPNGIDHSSIYVRNDLH